MAEIWHKTCQKQALFTSFRDFTVISRFLFFDRFWRFKSVLGSFFACFAKIWPKNMYRSSKSRIFLFDLFYLATWDDLDLYYGHKSQEMMLTNVSDAIHADSLALFALNIDILLADVTKPEMSHFDFDLTCDVTGDPEVIKICYPSTIFPGLSNAAGIFGIGPVVSEIRGGGARNSPPSPVGRVIIIPQWGAG